MTTQSLKDLVIQSVSKVENDELLQGLLNYIELESDKESIYEFDASQLSAVEEAKNEVLKGKTQSDSAVNTEIDVWLNK